MRWLIIGDSHTEVLGELVAAHLAPSGMAVVFKRGQGVQSFLDHGWLVEAGDALRPDAILIMLGGNDGRFTSGTGAMAYRSEVARLIEQAHLYTSKVFWVGPFYAAEPVVQQRHRKASEQIEIACAAMRVPFLNGETVSYDLQMTPDEVHFPRASYATMAQRIAAWVTAQANKAALGLAAGVVGAGLLLAAWWFFVDR